MLHSHFQYQIEFLITGLVLILLGLRLLFQAIATFFKPGGNGLSFFIAGIALLCLLGGITFIIADFT